MGIQSLTSYLENRSREYFENYKLHDCNLVIDGSSLCFRLYNWEVNYWRTGYLYDCYGGDYDKYAELVKCFFNMLKECNVTPYVVFGGRNGDDRLPVIQKRQEVRVKVASEVTPEAVREQIRILGMDRPRRGPNLNIAVGAAGLKHVFRDIVKELQIPAFTCENDPDREIACLAKDLNCPVLSANSNFFVLGSMFIPFNTIKCEVKEAHNNWRNGQESYAFIMCRVYRIEYLLDALNKRPNNNFIPYLLPVLLGSDYIKQEIFEPFFRKIGVFGSRQERIEGVFEWIRKQNTLEAALKEILDCFVTGEEKDSVSKQINHAIVGYSSVSTLPLLKHFKIGSIRNPSKPGAYVKEAIKKENTVSEFFMKRLQECRYPSFLMDILLENRYFLQANIEDHKRPDANSIGFPIMAAIHNILVQDDEKRLMLFKRNDNNLLEEYILPPCTDQLPSVEEIDYLRLERRQDILLKVLQIDQGFCQIFEQVPREFELFLLSLKYSTNFSEFDSSFIYSLLLCFITVNYVSTNLKVFCRTVRDFEDIERVPQDDRATPTVLNQFPKISEYDSYIFMRKIVKYFEMDNEDNAETYNREILHFVAEFQCVFLHLKCLNNLLDFPFKDAVIYKFFNGTFVYNMTQKLRIQPSAREYLEFLLNDCLSIHYAFFYVVELLKKHSIF